MSKKRKEAPTSTTLLDFKFFLDTPGKASTDRNSARRKIDAKADGQTCSKEKLLTKPNKPAELGEEGTSKPEDREIIVIESDDEDQNGVLSPHTAYVKSEESESEDVEILQTPRRKSERRKPEQISSSIVPFDADLGSGKNLLNQLEVNNALKTKPFVKPASSSTERKTPPEINTSDWDDTIEDDRLEYLEVRYQNGETSGIVGSCSKEETDDGLASCPVCNIAFIDADSEEIQSHINNCLDIPAEERKSPEKTPKSSIVHSISSLRFPSTSNRPPPKPIPNSNPSSTSSTAFSVLMSGKASRERAAWEEAQAAENRKFRPTKNDRRSAPFYKVLTGMPIAVDAFRYGRIPGVTSYFLTHAHSDHYTNLSSSWKEGYIYCSETTANLIMHMLSVDKKWIRPLPMDIPTEVPDSGGVTVTLIDANHCPGSCLFLFEGLQTVNAGDSTYRSPHVGTSRIFRYLHCGDFRACPRHVLHPSVHLKHIDIVYLDTTYLNPKYCFPPQPLVIDACAELASRIVKKELSNNASENSIKSGLNRLISGWVKIEEDKGKSKQEDGDTLVVVGTYSIGKERVVKAIAKILNTKVYCDARKTAILRCQADPELHSLLTNNPLEAGVHVVPLSAVTSDRFKDYMGKWNGRWTSAVAFRPTGWTYSPPAGSDLMPSVSRIVASAQSRTFSYTSLQLGRNSSSALRHYGVPYSEHSSFSELTCFALSLDWTRIIATVNVGTPTGRAKMQSWIDKWDAERKRRREAGESNVVEYRSLDYW